MRRAFRPGAYGDSHPLARRGPLIEGLRSRLIGRDEAARRVFPQIKPLDFQTAVHLALGRIQRDNVETSWSDALVTVAGDVKPYTFTVEEGMFIERRQKLLDLSPTDVFRPTLSRERMVVHGLG
jgi:hypothetical protein